MVPRTTEPRQFYMARITNHNVQKRHHHDQKLTHIRAYEQIIKCKGPQARQTRSRVSTLIHRVEKCEINRAGGDYIALLV